MLAVTVLAFPVPLSLIVAGVSSRVTFPAAASSSLIASVTSSGVGYPHAVHRRPAHRHRPVPGVGVVVHRRDGLPPCAVLFVSPAGMERVVFPVSVVMSAGFTDTVTVVTGSLDAEEITSYTVLAVTVLAFPVPLTR